MKRLVIVGAGLSGLTAARALAGGHDVVVLDKSRGVGGRMATRRVGAATIDHGAQFFTTHTAQFAGVVAGWVDAGVALPWFVGRIGPHGALDADGHTRFRGRRQHERCGATPCRGARRAPVDPGPIGRP